MSFSFCFIGGIVFPNQYVEVSINSKCGLQNAANAFQLSFIDGLRSNLNQLDVINLPFIGSWPINYKSRYAPKNENIEYRNSVGEQINCKNLSFLNLTYLKNYFREKECYKALKIYCLQHAHDKYIYLITYTLHQPFLRAVKKIKKRFKNVRSIVIVTDLPEFKNDIIPTWKKFFLDYDTHITKEEYNVADAYILLTKFMADKVVFNNQPYEIIEGLYTPHAVCDVEKLQNNWISNKRIIFYSGTLARRYNIMNLVDAVSNIKDDHLRLQICGTGNCKDEILKIAEKDTRIEYLGELPHEEVIKLQRKATLLVNPRTDEGEFTKYSFPSKTMEYLSSGTPTLLYRLPGIPDEYYNYCFNISNPGTETLKSKIEEILLIPKQDLILFGMKAQEFINTQKKSCVQTQKVLNLLERMN